MKGGLVTEIKMPSDFTIQPGTMQNIPPYVRPDTAWDKSLTWSTSNKSVIAVDSSGNVTALKRGSATITCRNKVSGKTGRVKVTAAYDREASNTIYRFYGVNLKSETYQSFNRTSQMLADIYNKQMGSGTGHSVEKDTVADALGYLQGFADDLDSRDVTVIYLAGQGVLNADPAYDGALYCEANPDQLLTVAQVQAALENVPGTVILMVDADYSGAFIGAKGAAASKGLILAGQKAFHRAWAGAFASGSGSLSAKALPDSAVKGKFKVMTSCLMGRAYSSGRYRVFGYWLAKGMGAQFDGDGAYTGVSQGVAPASKDAIVTLTEMYAYAKAGVKSMSTVMQSQTVNVWPSNDPTAVIYPVSLS